LGFSYEVNDALNGGIFCTRRYTDFEHPLSVNCARDNGIAFGFRNEAAFASHRRLVNLTAALQNHTVHGKALAGFDQDHIANLQRFDRHNLLAMLSEFQSLVRCQIGKSCQDRTGMVIRVFFHCLGDVKEH